MSSSENIYCLGGETFCLDDDADDSERVSLAEAPELWDG